MKEEEAKEREKSGVLFEVIGDRSKLNPQEEVTKAEVPTTSAEASKKGKQVVISFLRI